MLDTGIDVPEVLNLVFFKKVMSKAKFWQMIGRGTRLCPGLLDGKDKNKFYIFDFCGNFEFFRMNSGKPTANQIALQSAIFHLKSQIIFKLQDMAYQTEDLTAFRKRLILEMITKVCELNRENFAVKQHLKYVELYAYLAGKGYGRHRSDLFKKVSSIASVANIPEIAAKSELINKILHTDYLNNCGINEFEHIRESLRNLIKYIPHDGAIYNTNFTDDILSTEWNEPEIKNDDLKNYKTKAEFYVIQHQNNSVIAKLKGNVPLTKADVAELERILWNEVGTKEEYAAEYGDKPLGEFVREIVGLDMNAAKEAFAEFLNNTSLDSKQIYFVNQIIEYIVHNGIMKDLSVLREAPFTDKGSVVEVFTDISMWGKIRGIIEKINMNTAA